MGYIADEDIRGYRVGGRIVCTDCLPGEQADALTEQEIITVTEVEDPEGTYYCDECKKVL